MCDLELSAPLGIGTVFAWLFALGDSPTLGESYLPIASCWGGLFSETVAAGRVVEIARHRNACLSDYRHLVENAMFLSTPIAYQRQELSR